MHRKYLSRYIPWPAVVRKRRTCSIVNQRLNCDIYRGCRASYALREPTLAASELGPVLPDLSLGWFGTGIAYGSGQSWLIVSEQMTIASTAFPGTIIHWPLGCAKLLRILTIRSVTSSTYRSYNLSGRTPLILSIVSSSSSKDLAACSREG